MSLNLVLDKEIVLPQLKADSVEEVLDILSKALVKNGNVKEEYVQAIKEREEMYPTGLPSTAPGIAIPHADHDLVLNTSVAIATLKKPVAFKNMEQKDEEIPVQIVFMLAISEPHGQIEMLQKVVEIIQDEVFRKSLLEIENSEDLLEVVEKKLMKKEEN